MAEDKAVVDFPVPLDHPLPVVQPLHIEVALVDDMAEGQLPIEIIAVSHGCPPGGEQAPRSGFQFAAEGKGLILDQPSALVFEDGPDKSLFD